MQLADWLLSLLLVPHDDPHGRLATDLTAARQVDEMQNAK
jgi:hypothetical protein